MRRNVTALALAAALLALAPPPRVHAEPPGRPASPVVLADLVEREIRQGRSFVGTVEPVQTGEVDTQASGFVETLTVEAGDVVGFGDTIATLRTTTLEIRIRAAAAELKLREQMLLELQNGSRQQDKDRARAELREAQAVEQNAAWKLQAVEKLRRESQLSEEELREAQRALATAIARREAFQAALDLIEAGPRPERIAQAEATVAVQTAEVARLEDERLRHTITAPFKGFVVKKHTEVGAWLDTGEAVVDLVALDEVDIVVPVLEDAVVHLRRGMVVNVQIDALPEPHVSGTIHRIVPVADRRSRTVPVKVRVKNTVVENDALIKIGMFARITIAVGEPRMTLLAPKDAIVLGGRSPVVYVYDAESSSARPVPVELGVADADMIEVTGEVKAGDKVVIRGNERIFPGMKVRPVDKR